MKTSDYHFITHWHVEATAEEVYDIISNADKLSEWWPSVYLSVKTVEKGGEGGINKLVSLYTKGWLPYTLKWQFRVIKIQRPTTLAIEAIGDFVGTGTWTITPADSGCSITYDWQIEAKKPLLRRLSGLLKPIFSANHHWAMARGEESLKLELLRRKGLPVGPPRGPTFPHNLTNNEVL